MALVAVDGPTGVGKSTTARALGRALGAPVLLDPVSVSPLLDDYYTGEATPAAALAVELAFLRLRADLLVEPPGADLVVSDFSLLRTAPFSEFLASPDDRAVVLAAMREAMAAAARPDVLVLLRAEPATLLDRVRRRDRDAEGDLTVDHLAALVEHFEAWHDELVAQSDHVIELDTAAWDPHRADDLASLTARIRALLD